eukprot:CAMPEP_0170542434 /NCGR_PEP_ID=MMETSP0211-20121228/1858_1 /TAXON_ID=311385 /ORGANISM="Pseudokeronopsis sp., Strain OXSARD2" /LENGTH=66 /DNA_ID=CAMNT_0010845491 /DNA_START=8 /DNA_END=208 /DNA_ORIENTATION=-
MGNEKSKKSSQDMLFDASFEMKQQAKMLEKEAAKIQANEKRERQKVAAELKKGNVEFAKVYAENCI